MIGDWRGQETSLATIYQTRIEVILDGPPGARNGSYHYTALNQGALLDVGNRRLDWSGHWRMRDVVVDGQTVRMVHLDHLAGPHVGDFILTAQNVMVPQYRAGMADLSAGAYRVALYPVPPGSFGYGRP